jgi:hypothetical protein
MAWVICLISASRRTMPGARSPSRIRAGTAAAACSAFPELLRGLLGRRAERVDHLAGDGDPLAGGGAAQLQEAGAAFGFGSPGERLSPVDLGGGSLLRRVRDLPFRVIGRGGVGVEGVEGEPGAGVAEVVLLPPPGGQAQAPTGPAPARHRVGHAGPQRHTEDADQRGERARALAAMSGVLVTK